MLCFEQLALYVVFSSIFLCIGEDNLKTSLQKEIKKEEIKSKELSDYIDIDKIIPDNLIKHNPINLPFTLREHNQGFLQSYVIPNNLPEDVYSKQVSRQNNEKIEGHGYDLFNSSKKKIFLKCLVRTYGNKAKACLMARVSRQVVIFHCNPEHSYFDPIFAQLVRFIKVCVLEGHEENIDRQGNNGALIGSFYMLNAWKKEIYGNRTTIIHEKPQLALDSKKMKVIDLSEFTETRELTSPDEK